MNNPFSWDYLTAPLRETPTFGPFSTAYLVLLVLSFLFAAILYLGVGRRFAHNQILQSAIHVGSQWMMWVCALGLAFFTWRYMRINLITLYMRIWLYMTFVVYLASVGYFIYWLVLVYPRRKDAISREREIRRYMPTGASTPKNARSSASKRKGRTS